MEHFDVQKCKSSGVDGDNMCERGRCDFDRCASTCRNAVVVVVVVTVSAACRGRARELQRSTSNLQ
jgi:hypothetical protein